MIKMTNIETSKVYELKNEIEFKNGQVNMKPLLESPNAKLIVVALEKDVNIPTHKNPGDALVTVLEGTVETTIDKSSYVLVQGQSIIMPRNIDHSVKALENSKFLLQIYIN